MVTEKAKSLQSCFSLTKLDLRLLDLRLAVYIMLAVDGNGESEIVAIMLLADETGSTVSAAIKTFQDHNPDWTKTVSIMTDKDFVERKVFTDLFPSKLCL